MCIPHPLAACLPQRSFPPNLLQFCIFYFDTKAQSALTFPHRCICITALTFWCQRFNFLIRGNIYFPQCTLDLIMMVIFLLTTLLLWGGCVGFPKIAIVFALFRKWWTSYRHFQLVMCILDNMLCTSCLIEVFDYKKKFNLSNSNRPWIERELFKLNIHQHFPHNEESRAATTQLLRYLYPGPFDFSAFFDCSNRHNSSDVVTLP